MLLFYFIFTCSSTSQYSGRSRYYSRSHQICGRKVRKIRSRPLPYPLSPPLSLPSLLSLASSLSCNLSSAFHPSLLFYIYFPSINPFCLSLSRSLSLSFSLSLSLVLSLFLSFILSDWLIDVPVNIIFYELWIQLIRLLPLYYYLGIVLSYILVALYSLMRSISSYQTATIRYDTIVSFPYLLDNNWISIS